MNKTASSNGSEPAKRKLLVDVKVVIEALTVRLAIVHVADVSVFVLDAIAEGGMCPGSLGIIALVFESGAIDAVHIVRREIVDAVRIAGHIQFVVAVEIVEAGEMMSPSIRRGHGEFHATQQIVVVRPFVGIGWLKGTAVEIPLSR